MNIITLPFQNAIHSFFNYFYTQLVFLGAFLPLAI